MISQAKIDANRRNAAKSTGPRTAKGKAKVRLNAVTHGLTPPPSSCRMRMNRLISTGSRPGPETSGRPVNSGRYLVERLVRISWQLDRADTAEQARLTRRIQDAPRLFADGDAEPAETSDRQAARDGGGSAGRHFSWLAAERLCPGPFAGALADRELESSAEGCRRLLAEWTRILDWLGPLGPEGIASSEFHSRLDNI